MAQYTATVFRLLKKLRWKAKDKPEMNAALDRIVWHSFPVVFPNASTEVKKIRCDLSAIHQRRKRVRKYVREMAQVGRLYLVSLTFGDCYDTTTRRTRDIYARSWLNKHTADYFACLDKGKTNGREHYHAIVRLDYPVEEYKVGRKVYVRPVDEAHAWEHGFYTMMPIKTDESDLNKTLEYAMKASTYAFKTADEDDKVKPFHKRGVKRSEWMDVTDDMALPF